MDGEVPTEVDYSKIPIQERLVHKVWKARVSAYTELSKSFRLIPDSDSKKYDSYLSAIPKMVVDANVVAQESALDAVLSFVQSATVARKTVGAVIPGVIDKCLGGRDKARSKGVEIALMFCEIEEGETVLSCLVIGFKHKQPKVAAQSLAAVRECVVSFGPKPLGGVKGVLKALSGPFAHANTAVRSEAMALAVELSRWITPAVVSSQLKTLKPVQEKELEAAMQAAASAGAPKPTRYTHSEQENANAADNGDEDGQEDAGVEDALSYMEETDVLNSLPANFFSNMEVKLWKTKKEALEALTMLTSQPKLKKGDYAQLVRALMKALSDINVLVVSLAAKCLGELALGLRAGFTPYSTAVLLPLLGKFKEKKVNVVAALHGALTAIFPTTTLDGIKEAILEAAENKNPSVRAATLTWLIECVCKTPQASYKTSAKELNAMLVLRMADSDANVRDRAAECLGCVWKLLGDRAMAATLDKLDDIKRSKVKEFFDKAVVKGGGSSTKKAPSTTIKSSLTSRTVTSTAELPFNKENSPPSSDSDNNKVPVSSSSVILKKAALGSKGRSNITTAKGSSVSSGSERLGSSTGPQDNEVLASRVNNEFPENILANLKSSKWQERKASLEELIDSIADNTDPELFLHVLSQTPGWKDSNFHVNQLLYQVISKLALSVPRFPRFLVTRIAPHACSRLGDIKVKTNVASCLTALAEATSLDHVAGIVLEHGFSQKAPKAVFEAINWLDVSLKEFGMCVTVKPLIASIDKALSHQAAPVRSAAISLIGTLRMLLGPSLRSFFENQKPAVLTLIDAELDRVADLSPPEVSRTDRDTIAENKSGGGSKTKSTALPRSNIENKITDTLVAQLSDNNWKERGEGLERVGEIIKEANMCIEHTIGDLPAALKGRLSDSNKMHICTTLSLIGQVFKAMGSASERHTGRLLPSVLKTFTDGKPHVRAAAASCITDIVANVGLPSIIEPIAAVILADSNPNLRSDLCLWLTERLADYGDTASIKTNVSELIVPLFSCLEDRSMDVRAKSSALFSHVVAIVGSPAVVKKTSKLKPASQQNIMQIIGKVQNEVPNAHTNSNEHLKKAQSMPQISGAGSLSLASAVGNKKKADAAAKSLASSSEKEKKTSFATSKSGSKSGLGRIPAKSLSSLSSTHATTVSVDADEAPLIRNTNKDARATRDKKTLKWSFDVSRPEFIEVLRTEMLPCVSKTVHAQLFSNDFKLQLLGLQAICEWLRNNCEEAKPCAVESADVILKYVTLRFFDTNTTVQLQVLDLLLLLFSLLDSSGYHLLDYEANLFMPHLVRKAGDKTAAIRKQVRDLFKLSCNIYPASKLFVHIMDGLKPKNARCRIECLEELGRLISRHTLGVCQPSVSKALASIATHVSDRDNGVRSAALNALVEAYRMEGDLLWKHVGAIPAKDTEMLEERIKRMSTDCLDSIGTASSTALNAPISTSSTPSRIAVSKISKLKAKNVADTSRKQPDVNSSFVKEGTFSLDLDTMGLAVKSTTTVSSQPQLMPTDSEEFADVLAGPTIKLPARGRSSGVPVTNDVKLPSTIIMTGTQSSTAPLSTPLNDDSHSVATSGLSEAVTARRVQSMDYIISQVSSEDRTAAIQALRRIEEALDASDLSYVRGHTKLLLEAVSLQFRIAFCHHVPAALATHCDATSSNDALDVTARLIKHCCNVCMQFFTRQALALNAPSEGLQLLLSELIVCLLNPQLGQIPDGVHISRVLNKLVLKILTESDRNISFAVLFSLLDKSLKKVLADPSRVQEESQYRDLIMKCLWKLTKAIGSVANEINIDTLVFEIHKFLCSHPPSFWLSHGPPYDNDLPLRTAKTVLHALVVHLGDRVIGHLTLVRDGGEAGIELGDSSVTTKIATTRDETAVFLYLTYFLRDSCSSNQFSSSSVTAATSSAPVVTNESEVVLQPISDSETTVMPSDSEKCDDASTNQLTQVMKDELAAIFKRIGNKETTQNGLLELYDFKQANPNIDVTPWYSTSSEFFQSYIDRGLSKISSDRFEHKREEAHMEKLRAIQQRVGMFAATPTLKSEGTTEPTNVSESYLLTSTASSMISKTESETDPTAEASRLPLNSIMARLALIKANQKAAEQQQ